MSLDEKLDAVFSVFVRLRFADYRGLVHCYTCPWIGYWKETDAGHWIRRGNEAVRWDEDNARPQCGPCNRFHDGRPRVFEQELRDELGDEKVDELEARSVKGYPSEERKQELLIHYRKLVKRLDTGL